MHAPLAPQPAAERAFSADKLIPLLEGGPPATTSNFMLAQNLLNNYVGMVLLSMHFAFARTGWMTLPLLAVLTALGAWTGELIIESYRTICAEGVSVPSYAQIGERCMGAFGKWLVVVSSVVETYTSCLCILIIIWANTALLLPNVELPWIIVGCSILSFPTNWLRDFTLLSFLSVVGTCCVLLIIVVVVYNVFSVPPSAPDATTELFDVDGIAMSSSIILAGLTGHVALPPMFAEMRTPSAFRSVLYTSFLGMFVIYGVVGGCGYALYGSDASVLITHDISKAWSAPNDGAWVGPALANLVLGAITFKLFCSVRAPPALHCSQRSVLHERLPAQRWPPCLEPPAWSPPLVTQMPLCIVVLVDIAQTTVHEWRGKELSPAACDVVRLLLWGTSVINAACVYSWLQYVTALIGINSMLISVLLPIVFYYLLHRRRMSAPVRAMHLVLMVLSLALTIAIGYVDVNEFVDSLRRLHHSDDESNQTTLGGVP